MVRISTRINLVINKIEDAELKKKVTNLKPATRIEGEILFTGKNVSETTIIDTGAHISVLPYEIWEHSDIKILTEHYMMGIIPEVKLPVKVGYVKARLIDENNESREIKFLCYLALTNKIKLVLGFRDLLEESNLHILFSEDIAYLEEIN